MNTRILGTAAFLAAMSAGAAVAQETPACAAGTHLFEHELLISAVCVPDDPQRVAFIDDIVLSAIELGVPSVTSSHYSDIIVADFPGLRRSSRARPASATPGR
ncbi:MAG: hypothetical protein ACO1OG_09650 [Devosia sp.]